MTIDFHNGYLFAVMATVEAFESNMDTAHIRLMLGTPKKMTGISQDETNRRLAAILCAAMDQDKDVAEIVKMAIGVYNRNQKV
jgi:hypothetical protein